MPRTIREIMNHEVFSVRPTTDAEQALGHLMTLGVSGAPVIDADDQGRAVGFVSLRDLVGPLGSTTVAEHMTWPAVVVDATSAITEAGKLMGVLGLHHLIVVEDHTLRPVGIVSSLDLVRALTGLPAAHPSAFPHFDRRTGLVWTDDIELELESVLMAAPDAPGLFLLVRPGVDAPDTIVWAESAENVKSRLIDLVSAPQPGALGQWLDRARLRFRAAQDADPEHRNAALAALVALAAPAGRTP